VQPFELASGVAAPLLEDDLNTDQISPVTTAFAPDYAELLFTRRRRRTDGTEDPAFVLNRGPFRNATVLVTGANFGCGSSRESAVWALGAFGIRCIVARSFADIFRENCIKNGLLPVTLGDPDAAAFEQAVVAADGAAPCTVDLVAGRITGPGPVAFSFEIAAAERNALLRGLDDIGLTLESAVAIAEWEARAKRERPWLQEVGR
jgi:3-isopropylmalate/(R)-2-methylmalate dehydratase small subunit